MYIKGCMIRSSTIQDVKPPETDDIGEVMDEAETDLDDLCARIEASPVTNHSVSGKRIALAVAKAHKLNWRQMVSERRCQQFVRARHHAWWLMDKYTGLSYPQMARIFGRFDHTTVMWGIKRHQQRINAGDFPAQ